MKSKVKVSFEEDFSFLYWMVAVLQGKMIGLVHMINLVHILINFSLFFFCKAIVTNSPSASSLFLQIHLGMVK